MSLFASSSPLTLLLTEVMELFQEKKLYYIRQMVPYAIEFFMLPESRHDIDIILCLLRRVLRLYGALLNYDPMPIADTYYFHYSHRPLQFLPS